jgi:MoxR-vWA-beta-propeller ternary system domain bpX4
MRLSKAYGGPERGGWGVKLVLTWKRQCLSFTYLTHGEEDAAISAHEIYKAAVLRFLRDLIETGRVTLPLARGDQGDADHGIRDSIVAYDADCRSDLAHSPPVLSLPAALWGLQVIEQGCRLLVYRELDEGAVKDSLSLPCPEERSASRSYSTDLFLR